MNRPRIVLFQPDIPGNTGTILRMAACLDLDVHIVEPAGFRLDDRSLQRAGMDYLERARLTRHQSWEAFEQDRKMIGGRLLLFSTKAKYAYSQFVYAEDDWLLFGRESGGVPDDVFSSADETLTIMMAESGRSLNLAVSVAMVAGEVRRQLPLSGNSIL